MLIWQITSIPESTTVRWRSKDSLVIASGHDTHSFDPLDEESSSDSPPVPVFSLRLIICAFINLFFFQLRNQSKDLSNLIYQRVMNGYGLNEGEFLVMIVKAIFSMLTPICCRLSEMFVNLVFDSHSSVCLVVK